MQISKINNLTNINFKKNWKHSNRTGTSNCNFELPKTEKPSEISISIQKEERFFEEFIKRKGKVTKKEYEEIIKNHPSTIIKAQKLIEKEKPISSTPLTVAKASLKLKERYDNEYNKDYLIASIGTSPSPITEVMQALGCNVVFLPISGLNTLDFNPLYLFRNQYPTIASRNENIKYIVDFAQKNGINNKNKNFLILLDYCSTGTSLDNICRIFEEEHIFNLDRMHDHSILGDLGEISTLKDRNSIFKLEDLASLSRDMQYSAVEKVSNVPHFYIYDEQNKLENRGISSQGKTKKELFKEFENFSQPLARAYSLCAIHEAMKLSKNYIS